MNIENDISPTLRAESHQHEPVVCYAEKRFFEWHEDEKSVTLRNRGGSYGGQRGTCDFALYQATVGALCMDDYKGPNRQYVDQEKLIVCLIRKQQDA